MASKRDYADSASDNSVESAAKRSKNQSNKARQHQNSHIDPTWGQKYVFGNHDGATTVPVDPELDFEDDGDAMAYLKSVRQEANGIPHLLVAPKIPIGPQLPTGFQPSIRDDELKEGEEDGHIDRGLYDEGTGDFRGRYVDGAYIGAPESWDDDAAYGDDPDDEDGAAWDGDAAEQDDDDASDAAIHEAYFASLLSHYSALRTLLHSKPPDEAVQNLSRTHSPFVGHFGPRSATFKIWDHRLRTADPSPVQVASMDKDSVLRVLRVLLSGSFLRRGGEIAERTSRWVWALLARLPDRGELNHVEMSWIRDLGRRAVLMNQSLADMANLREALEGDLGVHDAIDDSSDDEAVLEDMEVDENDGEVVDAGDAEDATADREVQAIHLREGRDVEQTKQGETDFSDNNKLPESEPLELAVEPRVEPRRKKTKDDDVQSEPMDCSEDGEASEGQVPRDSQAPQSEAENLESLEAMRSRILAELDTVEVQGAEEEAIEKQAAEDRWRARTNMRATLNMILTVAGDFYGQRDLLEFREPFTGM
ncbi:hypothetical protein VD0004_g6701 [Verticillium dahliae]|uniref:V-snare n=1 Tax=Verticillium dahliae TaxID=27337 RepID=A0A444S035_VERDA|nr:hypothetical protein VD0004_g6701 [Verticillium dahliae]PNH71832.1 hypothetical protein VD0001_g5714 [Verticillium dahliae]RXG46791.1 hypothetical protein VDGE_01731 [Verticillium dahliae]